MIRLRGAEIEGEERTDGLEEEEEGCRWAQQPHEQQTGY